jgi:hypothetical protein
MKTSFGRIALVLLSSCVLAQAAPRDGLISEDFESTRIGEIPKDFIKTGAIGVADDVAHSGKKALRIEPATKGGRLITLQGDALKSLGGDFWGRMYIKFKTPAPLPVVPEGKTSGIIHTTFVSGKATSPLASDPIEVRLLGSISDMSGSFKYLYNVQPRTGRKEFGVTSKKANPYSDEWILAEWHVDSKKQAYELFINGDEVKDVSFEKGAGKLDGAELPELYESLSFGLTNYQPAAGEGFTAWIDDLALGKKRLGPVAKTSR